MATLSEECLDRKDREATDSAAAHTRPVINSVMNRGEWAILLGLALIWGAAFFFIKVAVTHVEPLTYVWLRLSIAAVGLWLFLRWRGGRLDLPMSIWGAILVLTLLNNVIPFALFGWGQRQIASGLAAILIALYSGRPAKEISETDAIALFDELGLREHLSTQRSNGLVAMVNRIRSEARAIAA